MLGTRLFEPLPYFTAAEITGPIALPYFENAARFLAIETCLAVGAVCQDTLYRIKIQDVVSLRQARFYSELLGFNWAMTSGVRVANHLTDSTHDYIWDQDPSENHPDLDADMVVACFLPIKGHSSCTIDNPSRFVSSRGNTPDDWRLSIEKRQPKIVLTVQSAKNPGEIIAPDIRPKGYVDIPTLQYEVIQHYCPAGATPSVEVGLANFLPIRSCRLNMHGIVREDIAKAVRPHIEMAAQTSHYQYYNIR